MSINDLSWAAGVIAARGYIFSDRNELRVESKLIVLTEIKKLFGGRINNTFNLYWCISGYDKIAAISSEIWPWMSENAKITHTHYLRWYGLKPKDSFPMCYDNWRAGVLDACMKKSGTILTFNKYRLDDTDLLYLGDISVDFWKPPEYSRYMVRSIYAPCQFGHTVRDDYCVACSFYDERKKPKRSHLCDNCLHETVSLRLNRRWCRYCECVLVK